MTRNSRLFNKKDKKSNQQVTLYTFVEPLFYLLPFIIGASIFIAYPLINVFIISLKENYEILTGSFSNISLENYKIIINDPNFLNALKSTGIYVFSVVPTTTI